MSYGNGALSKNSSAKKADCSLDDLFDYLSAKGGGGTIRICTDFDND